MRSNDDVAYPNLMFHFLPIAVRYDGSPPAGGHGYQVHVGPMYSDARGSVRITSPDARVKPALRFNYLSTDQDRREWVEAIRVARHILGQPAFAPFDGGEVSPGPASPTDERDPRLGRPRRRDRAPPVVHVPDGHRRAVGGRPATRCGVHGVEGCVSSTPRSMPYVTNGNIYAPVMMLAEKAADLILGNTPLAAGARRLLPPSTASSSADVCRSTMRIRSVSGSLERSADGRRGCVTSSPSGGTHDRRRTVRRDRSRALDDDELVKQMHDDLYDGLADEIVEGTTILLDRGWGAGPRAQRGARRGHAHRRHRLPRRHPVRARGAARRQRDEGRHGDPAPAARRDRRRADRQDRDRHRQGRHPRHRQEPRGDDAGGRRLRGHRPRHQQRRRQVPRRARASTSPTSSACRRCSRRRCRT